MTHQPDEPTEVSDPTLAAAVRELEQHAAEAGWDQPSRLYALVPTADLVRREPQLATALGVDQSGAAGTLTPVEQDQVPQERRLEEVLPTIIWPPEVFGCAAVVERLVLPPDAEAGLPEPAERAEEYAADHPGREEVRIVAAATRAGSTYCALRTRSRDDPQQVVQSVDLVPGLLELLRHTLED